MIVWLNGTLTDATTARIDPADRGFLLGDGLFETMLARNGHVVFLDAHLLRLMRGGEVLNLRTTLTPDGIARACAELLEANDLASAPRAALRLTVTRGPAPRGLALPADPSPTVLIGAAAAPAPPASLTAIVATPRRNAFSPSARLKALPYLDNVLAKEEARVKGADDALLLDTGGYLSCATAANVFLWEGERLVTPSDECGILPGITRAALLELAQGFGIGVAEERVAPERLARADGVFLTNSLMGVVPLTRIEGREIPAHPLTARLAAAYELLLEAADEND
jgi:branched-chain amino acid aminotransferase